MSARSGYNAHGSPSVEGGALIIPLTAISLVFGGNLLERVNTAYHQLRELGGRREIQRFFDTENVQDPQTMPTREEMIMLWKHLASFFLIP